MIPLRLLDGDCTTMAWGNGGRLNGLLMAGKGVVGRPEGARTRVVATFSSCEEKKIFVKNFAIHKQLKHMKRELLLVRYSDAH